ncbi:UTRA domain-containing protein [Streptosporangium sp. NPDC002524]|uniref:GntR family transcriptional regulator n=1 Tax=Streptosporangium sp. NPDC002524 TaxID=3154537 RepID=UPI00332B8733
MDLETLREVSGLSDPIERARVLSRLITEEQGLVAEAAKMRRQAIAEARDSGMSLEEVGTRLGVSPGRISQMRKGPSARAPEESTARAPEESAARAPEESTARASEGPAPRTSGESAARALDEPALRASEESGDRFPEEFATGASEESADRAPGESTLRAPRGSALHAASGGSPVRAPRVLVRRALPTDPAVRASASLFLAEAERQGVTPGRRMLYVGPEPAGDQVAACLRVEPGAEVIARRKMMTADGVPVRVATSYFRADLFAGTRLAAPGFVEPSLQSALVALGHTFGHAEENLTARPPTSFEYETLELEPGEWVVQVLRAGYSDEDVPVHVLETICAASRHIFPIGQVTGHDEF